MSPPRPILRGLVFGSICSGIEAASAAWHPLGWRAAFLSEIEAFPRAVLSHHYPTTPLHGDFTTIQAGEYDPINVLVGGTPCQSFSVAGLRGGMADARGNLALEYLRLADRLRPTWLVWENVAGILSSNRGRDFGSFLGGLGQLGYGFAYRVLDAQFFGLAQRRKRVFVVGYLGDWRRAAAVLFEPTSLRGDSAPSRGAREGVTGTIGARTGRSIGAQGAVAFPWQAGGSHGISIDYEICGTLTSGQTHATAEGFAVRRLTPRECERLQGFPDDFTLVPYRGKPAADGPRYRALGNSMAVPCMSWIGKRIAIVNAQAAA